MFHINGSKKENKEDYLEKIKRARKKREKGSQPPYRLLAVVAAAVVVVAAGIVITIKISDNGKDAPVPKVVSESVEPSVPVETEPTKSAEELEAESIAAEKEAVVAGYANLGIVQEEGYVNVRQQPGTDADILGKIWGDSACDILEDTGTGWYKISSGGFEGYVSAEFVLTGDEAKKKAEELVELRAIVTTDNLNVRKEPNKDSDSVGRVMEGSRYVVKDQVDGWIEISTGFISADYAQVKYCLNEARKLDDREKVINLYDNLGISDVSNYLNIRDKPSETEGKIIGKMTSHSAGEILDKQDGWYKIKSGPVTGYVSSEYILTGSAAKDSAIRYCELMAFVATDGLNVRKEPSTDSAIWTQVSNSERYRVLSQTDGWVEIELDTTTGFVSTEFVDVLYALPEAIKFTPLVEKSSSGGKGQSSSTGSSTKSSLRNQIVNYALQFLGNPYVWGGTSLTSGADCSGFTMKVYQKFGVSLPHHSGSQAQKGKAVSSSNMRPGDLLFYTDSGGTINHVAMYIGNGQIVHAANKASGIKISNWNYRKPVKIVNVLGD